jgi:hypothetical protein
MNIHSMQIYFLHIVASFLCAPDKFVTEQICIAALSWATLKHEYFLSHLKIPHFLFRLKYVGYIFQQLSNLQMLGTGRFTLSALDTIGCLSAILGVDFVVVPILIPVLENLLGVHAGKQVWD